MLSFSSTANELRQNEPIAEHRFLDLDKADLRRRRAHLSIAVGPKRCTATD
jgi:hypothetical protein